MNFTNIQTENWVSAILELEDVCFETSWLRSSILESVFDTKKNSGICILLGKDGSFFNFHAHVQDKILAKGKNKTFNEFFLAYVIVMYIQSSQTFEILRLGVLPKFRRMGMAQKIMSYLEGLAQTFFVQVERILLELRNDNIEAKQLYLRMGYKVISLRKSYYRDGMDALIMEKCLIQS